MFTRVVAQSLYSLAGAVYLIAGVSVLLLGTGLLPGPVREWIVLIGQDQPNTLHIMQEFAATLVFVGLITFWFVRHYERSRPFHWAMTLFWGLVSLVHWFDIRGTFSYDVGQVINTIPFALFLAVGLLRQWAEPPAVAEGAR